MKTFTHARLPLLAILACLPSLPAADAATETANLSVSATVTGVCTITTSDVAFGAYDPTSLTPDEATGAVTVTCTSGTTYTISLNEGANPSTPSNPTTRRMKANTADYLSYTLYIEAAHTNIWGDGTNGTVVNPPTGKFTGNGNSQAYDVYGEITALQNVAAGSYTDTVVATVTYP